MIGEAKIDDRKYKEEKEKHVKMLKERMKKGHEQLEIEKN